MTRPPWVRGPGLVVDRHRATTAHLGAVYPFGAATTPGGAGPYVGVDVTGGGCGWFFDPFELYAAARSGAGVGLTNSNMLIVGEPGFGKSRRRQGPAVAPGRLLRHRPLHRRL